MREVLFTLNFISSRPEHRKTHDMNSVVVARAGVCRRFADARADVENADS